MESKKIEKTVLDLFNSVTDEDLANLEKSADLLMEVFKICIPVGDATCVRLMTSLSATESEQNYYKSVLELCNTIVALGCRVVGTPDPTEDEYDE